RTLMDVKRLLLLIPLAVLAYLIVVQWNQDYGQTAVEPQAPSFTSNQSGSGDSRAEGAEDGLAVPATNRGDSMAEAMPDETESAASRDLVAVMTDVLDLRIDPQGG